MEGVYIILLKKSKKNDTEWGGLEPTLIRAAAAAWYFNFEPEYRTS